MKRIIKWIVLGGIALVFIGTLVFLYAKSNEAPVAHQVDSPARMTIIKKTVATGKVIPRREIEVKAQVSGVVEKLYVVPGQTVKQGDIIARIALRPNMINVNSAEAQLLSARINLKNQAADLQRYEKLRARNVISESEYNQFLTEYNLQQEAVASAENALLLLKTGATKDSDKVSNMIPATIDGTEDTVPWAPEYDEFGIWRLVELGGVGDDIDLNAQKIQYARERANKILADALSLRGANKIPHLRRINPYKGLSHDDYYRLVSRDS